MNRTNKADKLVDDVFDEGFENYSRIKTAERHIDYLLDMCGTPHHKRKIKENMGSLSVGSGRPYDHPRKLRIKPVIDVEVDEIETDMSECGPVHGEEYPGEFEGASPNNLPEEEPAKEMTPQKKQNKINTVPNQDAAGLLAAIKGELAKESAHLKEIRLGSKAASNIAKKAKALMIKRRMMGKPPLSMKQAARMVQ